MNEEILLADDDRVLRKSLRTLLEEAGYRVVPVINGEAAVRRFCENRPDLVLLDVMMPRLNGFDACRQIRSRDAEIPILFLSALGDEEHQLRGFGIGGDDYLVKSLPDKLLLARISAALRRGNAVSGTTDFDFLSWRISSTKLEMRDTAGNRVSIGERELALLRLLVAHPGEVFYRDFLISHLWGAESAASENLLNVFICHLREKLGSDGASIRSVRGVGYVFR